MPRTKTLVLAALCIVAGFIMGAATSYYVAVDLAVERDISATVTFGKEQLNTLEHLRRMELTEAVQLQEKLLDSTIFGLSTYKSWGYNASSATTLLQQALAYRSEQQPSDYIDYTPQKIQSIIEGSQ